jgi:hypothetical protein
VELEEPVAELTCSVCATQVTAALWEHKQPCPTCSAPLGPPRARLDLDQVRADLDEASASGLVDGPDAPYNWAALRAMRTAERLLEEVTVLQYARNSARAAFSQLRETGRLFHNSVQGLREELDAARVELRRRAVAEHDGPCPHEYPGDNSQGRACVKPLGHDTHWNGAGSVWRIDDAAWQAMEEVAARARSVVDAHGEGVPRTAQFEELVAAVAALDEAGGVN